MARWGTDAPQEGIAGDGGAAGDGAAALVPSLGSSQRWPLSWSLGLGTVEDEARHGAVEDRGTAGGHHRGWRRCG